MAHHGTESTGGYSTGHSVCVSYDLGHLPGADVAWAIYSRL